MAGTKNEAWNNNVAVTDDVKAEAEDIPWTDSGAGTGNTPRKSSAAAAPEA